MKRSLALLLPLALVACQDTSTPTALEVSDSPAMSRGAATADVIVVLRDDFAAGNYEGNLARAAAVAQEFGLEARYTYGAALFGFAASVPEGRLAALRNDPRVAYVNYDQAVHAAAQTMPTGINRMDAEQSATAAINGSDERVNVDVAIIDTGIDFNHGELNVVGGKNCSTGSSYKDGNGHGTHVAGTVGAIDDGDGVVGAAPGARLWAVRVLDNSGSGSWSSVACGVDFVTANADKIEVANMSLGGSGSEPSGTGCATGVALHDAICKSVAAGVTYVVAAGNDYADASGFVPAAYDEVITVSALSDFNGLTGGGAAATCRTDEDDTFANFSNYGLDVDIIAPGVCINSTWLRGGFKTISGTSMASPHVAGGAALYKAKNPLASPADVKSALIAAGGTDWSETGGSKPDPDGVKEPLLNVKTF